ncbi:glycosyltransferase [Hafnia paralvei]|uniref:glycosyltransferase n=1 Tax=Hafnia paralvei TaxID=546367 RepID=UPI00163B9528|nr:glycosyltransferase [Hafnia paralvei]
MKKIVFVITKSEVGGAQTWVYEQARLLKKEYDIYLITSTHGWLTSKFDESKICIIPSLAKIWGFASIYFISRELRRLSADIVISSSANAGLFSRLSTFLYSHKSIYVSHGWSCIYNSGRFKWVFCTIERLLSFITDKIICVSDGDKEKAKRIIKIKEEKLCVIKNCVSPAPMKTQVNSPLRIIFVGRMTYPKRPDLLADVVSQMDGVELYFIGGGEYLPDLMIKYSKVKNIFFLGELSNFERYCDYDIFVLSSDSEGLPMSAIEAGSAGLPLILSDVGGCHELIFDERNGVVFENTHESLKFAISKVVNDFDLYYENSTLLKNNFYISNNKQHYIDLIES